MTEVGAAGASNGVWNKRTDDVVVVVVVALYRVTYEVRTLSARHVSISNI